MAETTPAGTGPVLTEGLGAAVQQATLVEILPTRIWVESDIMGGRHVMCQHEGMEPFEYASFHYSYAYTSNAGTWSAAHNLALALGASEPVEERQRSLPPMPKADEVRRQIESLQSLLASLESA